MVAPEIGEDAIWTKDAPQYEALRGDLPVFLGPPTRGGLVTAVGRCISKPAATTSSLTSAVAPKDLISFAKWCDTARVFGIRRILRTDGSVSPLTAFIPGTAACKPGQRGAVTLAMMVQDEEKRLGRCLESVSGWIDEVVVVDGGSKDSTREIARGYGASVIERSFDGNYAAQRNVGLERVRTPWVLMLDADEFVTPEMLPLLDRVTASGRVDGAWLHLLNRFEGEETPWLWPDRKLRLFKSGRLMAGRIHEGVQGVKRVAYLPLNGPFVVHSKTRAEHWDREDQYLDLDPTFYSEDDARRIREWRSERRGTAAG